MTEKKAKIIVIAWKITTKISCSVCRAKATGKEKKTKLNPKAYTHSRTN